MDKDLDEIEKEIEEKKMGKIPRTQYRIFFDKRKQEVAVIEPKIDEKNELIDSMFKDGIKYQVANNEDLQNKVLETAKTYTETKCK